MAGDGGRVDACVRGLSTLVLVATALLAVATPASAAAPTPAAPADASSPYGGAQPRAPLVVPRAQAPQGSYDNPVTGLDFPDPAVVLSGGTYYAFATGNVDHNVSEMSTTDLSNWPQSYGSLTDALPVVGSWATANASTRVWAPSVIEAGSTWLLFYAAIDTQFGVHCIGVATSPTPAGPYRDENASPLVCQPQLGGSIDPNAFFGTDGALYLAFKSDDQLALSPSTLWSVRLDPSPSGASAVGAPVALLTSDQAWEQNVVENPSMTVSGDHYLLLFSGGRWDTSSYATGYALCLGPQGPCQEPFDHPILSSSGSVAGPGGASTFGDANGRLWVAYAAWTANAVGYGTGGSRSFRVDPLCEPGGGADIVGPTTSIESLAPLCATTANEGYSLVDADGGVFNYGTPFLGSAADLPRNAPIVATTADSTSGGYWEVASDGGVFAFDAPFYGSMGGKPLNAPIVGLAATRDGGGYWLVASDGGIFAFGDAPFYGSMGGKPLNAPIVGLAADRWSGGYWLVAGDGGIFAFGSATFYGSMGGKPLNRPVTSVLPSAGGLGYWLVASDGGIFAFGSAPFEGSTGSLRLNAPIVGGAPVGFGAGYWLVASDGGIFAFGSARFRGSTGGSTPQAPVVAMSAP